MQNDQQNLNVLKEEVKNFFINSEKVYFSKIVDELLAKLDIRTPSGMPQESKLMSLLSKIPGLLILSAYLNEKDDYILILKEKIHVPESLRKVMDQKDTFVKLLELFKQYTFLNEPLLANQQLSIQWSITDSKKEYWIRIKNNKFEYGKGVINNPTVRASASEINTIKYFLEDINLDFKKKKMVEVQGDKSHLEILKEICRGVSYYPAFFPGITGREHHLNDILDNQLLEVAFFLSEREVSLKWKLKREKEEKELKRKQLLEAEMKEKKEKERKHRERVQCYEYIRIKIQGLRKIYDEIKIDDIEKRLPEEIKSNFRSILKKDLTLLIENMIIKKDINARIRGEYLTFIKEGVKEKIGFKKDVLEPQRLIADEINILRGGDWKIEENQSVFYFKVKVRNNSKYVLTNIQILLTPIPSGLVPESDRYRIEALNPSSFESPTFKFIAKDSCVGDFIKGMVLFTDHMGNQQTISIKPFKIEYVCNLLVPKSITEENYEKNTASMQERKIIFNCDLTPDKLESEVAQILEKNNFYVLESPQKKEEPDFRKIKAYAEGKYDKQDVALSVIMQENADQAIKLIIKGMSNRQEKIIDLLKDLSTKCDSLKSTTEDSILIEVICQNCENRIAITEYMKMEDFIICEDCGEEIEIPK